MCTYVDIHRCLYLSLYIYIYETSKIPSFRMDIHKAGNVLLLTTRLHKHEIMQTCGGIACRKN